LSNMHTLRLFVVLLFAAFASAALVLADAGAPAQNSNSSPTEESAQNDNANAAPATRRGRRGRRGTRGTAATEMNANTSMEPGATPETSGGGGGQTEDLSGEQVDLSGTYEGRVTTTGSHEMSGAATLTITGNSFTLTGEGMNHTGRVYAVLTRGETSAAFYFSDLTDSTTNTPVVFNVRARKRGDSLSLRPAPFTKNKMTFTTGGR
jgi:hypothetical protein